MNKTMTKAISKTMCEIVVTLKDLAINPKDFYDCMTPEEVLDAVGVICQEAYGCDDEAIQSIKLPQEFWDDWNENHITEPEDDNCC